MSFSFDESKALSVVLFIINKMKDNRVDRHKLSKILYFADQKHLTRYGRPIIGDTYIAMKDGPVPSTLYDAIKSIDDVRYSFELFRSNLKSDRYFILSEKNPDMDELSESDVECLIESIKENAHLSFAELKDKSHGFAWNSAGRDSNIPIKSIAIEGKASAEMINYICENLNDFHITQKFTNG